MFAANVVAVGFRDRAQRDLAHLRAAADDDDALAENLLHGLDQRRAMNHRQGPQTLQKLLRVAGDIDLEIGDRLRRFLLHDFDAQDVALLVRDDAAQLVQHARAGIGAHFYSDSLGHS